MRSWTIYYFREEEETTRERMRGAIVDELGGGVESGLFHASGSRWNSAADVHRDENRESPREAER